MDHGISHSDTHGKRIQFLAEGLHRSVFVQLLQTFFHTGKHLACAHGHIVYGAVNAVIIGDGIIIRQQQIAHQVNDITAGEMGAGLFVVRLRETLDKIFKDIAHIYRRNTIRAHIQIFC